MTPRYLAWADWVESDGITPTSEIKEEQKQYKGGKVQLRLPEVMCAT